MWARQFGEACGVSIPNQAAEHYYLITEPMDSECPPLRVSGKQEAAVCHAMFHSS